MAFTKDLYQAYQEFYGQAATASQRMKEVWFYLIHLFEGGEKLDKQLRRSRRPSSLRGSGSRYLRSASPAGSQRRRTHLKHHAPRRGCRTIRYPRRGVFQFPLSCNTH